MTNPIRVAVAAALVLALSACATRGEQEFGSSVRHMVSGQKADPGAPREDMTAVDGQRTTKAVENYRADKKPAAKSAPVIPTLAMPTSQ